MEVIILISDKIGGIRNVKRDDDSKWLKRSTVHQNNPECVYS